MITIIRDGFISVCLDTTGELGSLLKKLILRPRVDCFPAAWSDFMLKKKKSPGLDYRIVNPARTNVYS